MSGEHALLSASASHRWLKCPPSVRLCEGFPDSTSPDAEKGRLAHAIAELKARKYFTEPMSERTFRSRLKKLAENPHYSPEMEGGTDAYLEHLKALALSFGGAAPFVALETRVDYSRWAPEGFGTADCILIGGNRLCVADYKNGAGVPVDAEANPQMMLYALGALALYAPIYGDTLQEIHLSIVQPNAGGVKEWTCTRAELEEWGELVVRPVAQVAWEGAGEFCCGEWCRFCKAKSQCRARAAELLGLESTMNAGTIPGKPTAQGLPLLTDAEIGEALARGETLVAWYNDLKDYALGAILAGGSVPGFKAVEGRSARDWAGGFDAAFPGLQSAGVAEALLWERKPVSPAGLEKAVGKAVYSETVAPFVVKSRGRPALAPESDSRPAYNAAEVAFGAGD